MTTTAPAAFATPTTSETNSAVLWRPALASGLAAAVAITALVAALRAGGVPLTIDGAPIPLVGFANLTLVCVGLGYLLALGIRRYARSPRRTFMVTTVVLTGASLIPDLLGTATIETRLSLMVLHLVAAAIVIPTLAHRVGTSHR